MKSMAFTSKGFANNFTRHGFLFYVKEGSFFQYFLSKNMEKHLFSASRQFHCSFSRPSDAIKYSCASTLEVTVASGNVTVLGLITELDFID
jgi:hypothetical protein